VRFTVQWFQRRSRWRAVRAVLEAATSADPSESAWPRRLGQLGRHLRDVYEPEWNRERNYYQAALRINPHDREARDGLLQTLFDMGRWSEALEQIKLGTPTEALDHVLPLKAACCANLGRREEADRLYCELEQGPRAAFARFCRSLIALEHGYYEDALRLLVPKTDEKGLDVLQDFFRRVSRLLTSGRSAEEIDGQELLDEMMGASAGAGNSVHEGLDPQAGSERAVGCRLCGWNGPRVLLWQDQVTGWVRTRCPRCSMISVNPLPPSKAIHALYTHEGRKNLSVIRIYRKALLDVLSASPEACRQLPAYREITAWGEDFCWDDYEKAIGDERRCLDVGCSAGRTVEMFRLCGWQAEGIDVDPQAVDFAQSKGLHVSLGTIDTLKCASPRYHLITLIDVIEHVENPSSLVRRCMELLLPNGLLYAKTPAADSLPHRFLGDVWLDSAEHLQFFSRRTLQRLLVDSGFQIVSFRQRMELPTPFLHRRLWQEQLFPELLLKWIDRLRAGDVVMFLARKPS
jgi:SAM-dependent methyltransferase